MSPFPPLCIGRDGIQNSLVTLPLLHLTEAMYILGKQGQGKSNYILTCAAQIMHGNHGLVILDPHGDLITDVYPLIPPHREEDAIILDLTDTEHPFGFDILAGIDPKNPESLSTGKDRVVAIIKKTWGDKSWGPKLEDLLKNAVLTLLENPGTTLADVPDLLTDATFRARLVANVSAPVIRKYWEREYPQTPAAQANFISPLMNKIRPFLADPLLSRMVSQSGTTPDFDELLATRKILLVRLNSNLEEATSLVGTTVVLRLFEAALHRAAIPLHQRHPFFIFADEFQKFATDKFGDLIEQARKFRVGGIMAHQRRNQLSDSMQSAVKGANNIMCFQVQADDAREMSREFATNKAAKLPPGDLLLWSLTHPDLLIREVATQLVACIPLISVQTHEDSPPFTSVHKHRFFAERLRRAVQTGNASMPAFPRQYVYGTIDLERGAYGRLSDAFASLRDRLLAASSLTPELLVSLDKGSAAVKLRQPEGMKQYLLRFPQAIPDDWSQAVRAVLAGETDQLANLPPAAVAAGHRARRIRERSRRLFACPSVSVASSETPPEPHVPTRELPVSAEVDIDTDYFLQSVRTLQEMA